MMKYIERLNYDSKITIKLVIPSGCNAKCEFCYMKDYNDIMKNDKGEFLNNFIPSLECLLSEINNADKVSLDITGNEPTYDVELLKEVLIKLNKFDIQSKVSRVTITTNGLNLKKVYPWFGGVINYVNISVHHYDKNERDYIFGCKTTPDYEYFDIVSKLRRNGITVSAICVVYKPIYNFHQFMNNFIEWCKQIGFISIRFRNDVFWKETEFEEYMNIALSDNTFTIVQNEDTLDSRWCRLKMNDKFRVFFLSGVKDTSLVVKGIEYVVADDGMTYTDFYKREKIENYPFTIGKVYDIIEE